MTRPSTEYWVLRVVRDASVEALTREVREQLDRGELCVVGGDLCQPVQEFADQEAADRYMRRLAARAKPGDVYKLVLSTDDLAPTG